MFSLICKHEKTIHASSQSIIIYPNFTRQSDLDTFTSVSLYKSDYVYFGGDYGFQRKLIETYICQLVGSSLSSNKFIDGCILEAFNRGDDQRSNWQKHFSYWILKYYLVQFDFCIGSQEVIIPKASDHFDQWAWLSFPRLLTGFVYLWTNHKTIIGPCDDNCSRCVVIDGHQKCRRRVCRAKEVHVDTNEFDALKIGCWRTPIRKSYFCSEHQPNQPVTEKTGVQLPKPLKKNRQNSLKYPIKRKRTREFGATNCRTFKGRSEKYVNRCSRSFGIIAAVTNCKIVLTFSEIFRSETLREIINLLCSTVEGELFAYIDN